MLAGSKLAPSPHRAAAVAAAWRNLTSNGPTLTGSERRLVIEAARAAWAGGDPPAGGGTDRPGLLAEAGHWLAVDAGGLTGEVVEDLEARGLDRFRYLETVGVVARLANVDFYARGLGAALPDLARAPDGTGPADRPTGRVVEGGGADRRLGAGHRAPGRPLHPRCPA